jgi:hypothetical protein
LRTETAIVAVPAAGRSLPVLAKRSAPSGGQLSS